MSATREFIRCVRCRSKERRGRARGWNYEARGGQIVAHYCPSCQTPDESREAHLRFMGALPSIVLDGVPRAVDFGEDARTDELFVYAIQSMIQDVRELEETA